MNKKIILLTIIYVALMIRDDYALSEPTDDYALSEPTVPEHLKTRIKHYKDAYYNSSIQKFLSLEPYTRASSTRAPQIYHEECLRLEKLYFTKWAVHYLSNEYEEAKKGDENADPRRDWGGRLRASISKKWKEREILDDVESAYIAEPRTNVNVNKDDKSLEEQAYEAYSTLGEELRSLVDLMGEAEFQRILLLTTLPKDEQIKMIIQAMDKDSTNCS
uniref:Polymorphic mucin truncated splice variant C1/3.1/2r1.2 n=1 Tax=Schistosoma mansoni TaxID=6183 RepID=B3V409_SCHMA|nr:polymorphic mucin truncated splice variant C1/3.1/2r1.2 [Schistosoma mansoni]